MTLTARRSIPTIPVAALVLGTLVAWVAFVRLGMDSSALAVFLVGWTVMMTAMMLPSAAPLVLVYGKRGRARLVLGYLFVWAAVGLPVYAIARAFDLMMVPSVAIATVLVVAGAYQFTPLKGACLRACRSPLDFCWALMTVLVGAAAMSVTAAALIAGLVFAEKVLPGGEWTARVAGIALFAAAVVVLV
jgi:predicted metal-binding membrane protein